MTKCDTLQPSNYVSLVQNGRICVENVTSVLEKELATSNFRQPHKEGGVWEITVSSENELLKLLKRLRDLDALFVGAGPDRHPASIFQEYRDKGLLSGTFKEIVWYSRDLWVINVK